jgi:uncharacterized protein
MLNDVERLVVLQERDRQLAQLQAEVDAIPPQRAGAARRGAAIEATLESAKAKTRQLDADRKQLELEVETRNERIARYSLQQFQTKRNEEYRALSHEIETCKREITRLEDQQLELMEQAEAGHRFVREATEQSAQTRRESERILADLAQREEALQKQLAELQAGRKDLAAAVEPGLLARYERLRPTKGEKVVVGVEHGACGGCHVGLPAQVILGCRSAQELVQCPNCGRILFYTRDMDMLRSE